MLFLLLTAGCGPDYKLSPDHDVDDLDPGDREPDISVDPELWDFGSLSAGETSTVPIRIVNDGDADLLITGISGPGAPYDVGAVDSVLVPPGGATTFDVSFFPDTAKQYDAEVSSTAMTRPSPRWLFLCRAWASPR